MDMVFGFVPAADCWGLFVLWYVVVLFEVVLPLVHCSPKDQPGQCISHLEIGAVGYSSSKRFASIIHGKRLDGERWTPLTDPSTGETFAYAVAADSSVVDYAVKSAQDAFAGWRSLTAHCRSDLLHALAGKVREERQSLASILSLEVGKPIQAAEREVLNAASLIDYFAEESLRLAGQIPLLGLDRQQVLIVREPIGVVGAITPFNYPLSTIACKMAPALAVGCTVVAKPDEHTPISSLKLAELALEAGLPPGAFNVITGLGPEAGRLLVQHPTPRLITFTGSTTVGKEIQAIGANWVRKVILELGGHCPAIIGADAEWQSALPAMVHQTFNNSGQYCYRISRIYVEEEIYPDFLREFVNHASRLRLGPPASSDTQIGPLNNADIFASVQRQVEKAIREGAHVELGGAPTLKETGGFYFPPTILTNVKPEASIMREEIFGPVVLVHPFKDIHTTLEEANATPYGLAAYLFTKDLGNALQWAGRIEAGSIWINRIHQAYPEAPFGGMKESGLGREKSHFGVEEYTELKTIYLSY